MRLSSRVSPALGGGRLTPGAATRYASGVIPRWLAPVVVVLGLLAQSVAAFAAAGVVNEVRCCCPDLESCRCHEHDEPRDDAQLQRCGGAVRELAPVIAVATVPPAPPVLEVVQAPARVVHLVPVLVSDVVTEPETPPF